MQISKYGITLKRLTHDDIELVRKMRNADHIRLHMQYQEEITPEQQKKWFESVDNFYNYYYLVQYQDVVVGLVNSKLLELEKGGLIPEGGIFIWNEEIYGGHVAVAAAILMLEFTFLLGFDQMVVKIKKENKVSIKYVSRFGFTRWRDDQDAGFEWYKVSEQEYRNAVVKIKKGLEVLTGDRGEFNEHDIVMSSNVIRKMEEASVKEATDTPLGKVLNRLKDIKKVTQ